MSLNACFIGFASLYLHLFVLEATMSMTIWFSGHFCATGDLDMPGFVAPSGKGMAPKGRSDSSGLAFRCRRSILSRSNRAIEESKG